MFYLRVLAWSFTFFQHRVCLGFMDQRSLLSLYAAQPWQISSTLFLCHHCDICFLLISQEPLSRRHYWFALWRTTWMTSTGAPSPAACWPRAPVTKPSGFTTPATSPSCPSPRWRAMATASTAAASAPAAASWPPAPPTPPRWCGPWTAATSRLFWSTLAEALWGSAQCLPTRSTWCPVPLMALWLCGISHPNS